ncbi:hypothetical protein EB052_00850 [bacterium]|nr:hypothetical protein [bacterium]
MSYKDFFKGKRVAIVGCGLHGALLPDIKFLAKSKANISVYDMRSEARLGKLAQELRTMTLPGGAAGRITSCTFGAVPAEELAQAELIILAPEISRSSKFLKLAHEAGVRIEYVDTLFFKLTPPITLIGIMGSSGKTGTLGMIYDMLRRTFEEIEGQGLFAIDTETTGALNVLKKIKKGDVVISRIPEQLMSEYCSARITPHVAVITQISKGVAEDANRFFGLLEFQTYNTFVVASDTTVDMLRKLGGFQPKSKIIRTRLTTIPDDWKISFPASFVRENAALALETALLFKSDRDTIRQSLENMHHEKGRLEIVKVPKVGKAQKKPENIVVYNDTASVRPESTVAAIRAVGMGRTGKGLVLILGGAYTGASYDELFEVIPEYVSHLIILPGSGTLSERWRFDSLVGVEVWHTSNIAHAVKVAKDVVQSGGAILFSPAFDAIGLYESRHARGDVFVSAMRSI